MQAREAALRRLREQKKVEKSRSPGIKSNTSSASQGALCSSVRPWGPAVILCDPAVLSTVDTRSETCFGGSGRRSHKDDQDSMEAGLVYRFCPKQLLLSRVSLKQGNKLICGPTRRESLEEPGFLGSCQTLR